MLGSISVSLKKILKFDSGFNLILDKNSIDSVLLKYRDNLLLISQ